MSARRGATDADGYEAAVRRAVEKAPPLTDKQIEQLRSLLPPVSGNGGTQ